MNTRAALYTAPAYIMPNRYRIGDSVAVLLLQTFIAEESGNPAPWYFINGEPSVIELLRMRACGAELPPCPVFECNVLGLPLDDIAADATSGLFIGSLWMWNHVFHQIGHRVNLTPLRERPYRAVFAPLLQADYSAERTMHPRFVADVARELVRHYGDAAVMILPDRMDYHTYTALRDVPITKIQAGLSECIDIIGNAELYIGGDTGLSHIAGMFPEVRQIGLHDRANTERHVEREFDHMQKHREAVIAICAALDTEVKDCEYRSFPNKRSMRDVLFDNHGMDGRTLETVAGFIRSVRAEAHAVELAEFAAAVPFVAEDLVSV